MPATLKKGIKVLIANNSDMFEKAITFNLNQHADIDVIGTAHEPQAAQNKVVALRPDVLVVDIETSQNDAVKLICEVMRHNPLPIIVLYSLNPKGRQLALEALAAGAIDLVCKPAPPCSVEQACTTLVEKIKNASKAQLHSLPKKQSLIKIPQKQIWMKKTSSKILAIGASAGGVQALSVILSQLPKNAPATLVVQHMPPYFTNSFAQRLNQICDVSVRQARDAEPLVQGNVLIAPGGLHMLLKRSGCDYFVKIEDSPRVCRQKPSVDMLFNSVAEAAAENAVGAILTGMGYDGADGLLNMRKKGALTIAQDEQSSIVYGMPKAAVECGAAQKIVPLHLIAKTLIELAQQ